MDLYTFGIGEDENVFQCDAESESAAWAKAARWCDDPEMSITVSDLVLFSVE